MNNVVIEENTVQVHIHQSKADQQGKGEDLTLDSCLVATLCPVKAIGDYLQVRGQGQVFFFTHEDGTHLTKYQFWKMTDLVLS